MGYSFGNIQRIVSGVFLFFSLLLILVFPILGVPLSLFFGFALTSSYGFQIEAGRGRCREYTKAFGIKRGAWKNLTDFPFVAVLKSQKGYTTASMSNRTVTTTDPVFEVFLLSETHRTKAQVAEFKDQDTALTFAKEFATVIEKKYARYSPQLSAKSRRRR
ncbi:hypothetical protein O3Q51_13385 [Cryomorphaceae bacterium 1068]|nr:hypothetical protein [Cryomorphaceae bacterium 1068]